MNEDFTINGKKGSFQQPRRYGLNESGFYQVIPFEGTAIEVKNRAAAYGLIGAYYEVEELYGGRARLNVYLSWANTNQLGLEVPINVWELEPQEVEKDLLDADFPYASTYTPVSGGNQIGQISKLNRAKIRTALDTTPEDDTTPPTFISDGSQASALSVYYLMRAGVRSFPVDSHVIRHTQIVSNRWAVQASQANTGRIFSRSSFIALEGVPSDLLFAVPTAPVAAQFIEEAGDLAYGWRKLKPTVGDAPQQKRHIVNTYQFGLWTLKTYGDPL